jgi:hypothetical protein
VTDALQFELGPYDVFQIAEHWLEPGEQTSEVLNALIRAA